MGSQKFTPGTLFTWNEEPYKCLQILKNGNLKIENELTGEFLSVEFRHVYQDLCAGKLKFRRPEANPALNRPPIDLSDYSESQQATAKYRLAVIKPLLRYHVNSSLTAQLVESRIQQVKSAMSSGTLDTRPISLPSVYRWIKMYANSGGDIRALIPQSHCQGGKGTTRLETTVETIVDDTIQAMYFAPEKIKAGDIWHEVIAKVNQENRFRIDSNKLIAPSLSTVSRRLKDIDAQEFLEKKKGRRMRKRQFSQYGQMKKPSIPLERVEIDHTLTDLIVVDLTDNLPLGRLWLTICIDIFTRYPMGYYLSFEPPSYYTVMECLYHAILPKTNVRQDHNTQHDWLACGVPHTLVIDNGKEFIGRDLDDACASLGILLQRTPIKTPHFKGVVERIFSTLNNGVFHLIPGTTFSNIFEKGDYDSLKFAALTQEELDRILNVFFVDIYANRFHRGIEDTPANKWNESLNSGFLPRVPVDPNEVRILLGRNEERALHHYGIEFKSIRYNNNDGRLGLALLRTKLKDAGIKKIKIKYHPGDLSHIYALDPFNMEYIKIPAVDQDYTNGLSLWKHEVIRHEVLKKKRRVDHESLALAKRKIQELISKSKERRGKKRVTRKTAARWGNDDVPQSASDPPVEKTYNLDPSFNLVADFDDSDWEFERDW